MMRSMFSGVSGLRAHQTRMDVIGNNIANVNTVGFKAGRATFKEVFNQTLKGSGAPDASIGRGGTNPMQVGMGIDVASIDILTARGSFQRTDNPTDLSIEGEGFFIVKAGNSEGYKFTRAGNFGLDKLGNLTLNGMNVQGWQDYGQSAKADGTYEFNTTAQVEAINIYSDPYNKNKKMIAAKATSETSFAGNLDSSCQVVDLSATPRPNAQVIVPMTVYDDLGNEHTINANFWKTDITTNNGETVTKWHWEIAGGASSTLSQASGDIEFNSKGQMISTGTAVSPTITVTPGSNTGADAFDINLDFKKMSMSSAQSSIRPATDGYPAGELVTFNISPEGIITGIYSNGQQQPLGMIALANFENPAGLQKAGDNTFIQTTNSGDFRKGIRPGTEGVGSLSPGVLEMSNVDLSREFTEMIVTQRGFQANSRIITTSDEMLQELVNLKR